MLAPGLTVETVEACVHVMATRKAAKILPAGSGENNRRCFVCDLCAAQATIPGAQILVATIDVAYFNGKEAQA